MRALTFVTLAVLFVAVAAMGINVLRTGGKKYGGEAGRQLASFDLSRESLVSWFCGGDENNCGRASISSMSFPEIRSGLALRVIQTLYDALNNKEKFPHLPHPLNLVQTGSRPETLQEGRQLLEPIHDIHVAQQKAEALASGAAVSYPYFGFIPVQDAIVIPGGPTVSYSTPCFTSVTAKAVMINQSDTAVTITTAGHPDPFCVDTVKLMGGASVVGEISTVGVTTFTLKTTSFQNEPAKMWVLENRGIVVGHVEGGTAKATLDLIATIVLIIGFAEGGPLPAAVFNASTDFYSNYIQYNPNRMGKISLRDADMNGHFVAKDIDTRFIKSGDVFMIIRPDGLDPTVAWTIGTAVAHTTVALWAPNRTLYVCESTAKDAYWPTNGVQCNPWDTWWHNAHKAQFNVVMLPLGPLKELEFDEAKAWDFFYANEGLNYGYSVFLSGWLDVKEGRHNSMCVPPDFKKCLTRNLMEYTFIAVDALLGNSRDNMIRQMLAHRVGLWPQQVTAAESIKHGQKHLGLNTFSDLYSIVEQDSWRYNTTRYGRPVTDRSMICNVFVCHMLKAGGLFKHIHDEIQCGESSLWTIYSSQIWDEFRMGNHRPQVCKDADPENPLCQMMGNWTVHLHPDLNSRPLYVNMSNHCPSEGPDYIYPDNC